MKNFLLNVKDFALNFVDDITRAFKTNELSGNEEFVRKNLTLINNVTKENYLDGKYSVNAKTELKKAKKNILTHQDDYIAYYRNAYLNEAVEYEELYIPKKMKREDYIKNIVLKKNYKKIKWGIGIASFLLFGGISFTFATILAIINSIGLPYFYELYHKPYQVGKKEYQKVLDNIEDKLGVTLEKESLENNEVHAKVAELSLKIAACLELINKEPYPNCIKEQEALVKLNAEFLQEERETKALPNDSIKPKLIFVSYESRLADIRRVILENQKLYRSEKLVESKVMGSDLVLDAQTPTLDTSVPVMQVGRKLGRYRIPKN